MIDALEELLDDVDDPSALAPVALIRHLARHLLRERARADRMEAELEQLRAAHPAPAPEPAEPRKVVQAIRRLEVDPWPDRWRAVQQRLREQLVQAGVRRGVSAGAVFRGESVSSLWALCEERQGDLLLSTLIRIGSLFGPAGPHLLLTGLDGPELSPQLLAERVRAERQRRGWSQLLLGHAAGLSSTPVQGLERGEAVRVGSVCRIAAVLGVFPELLLTA